MDLEFSKFIELMEELNGGGEELGSDDAIFRCLDPSSKWIEHVLQLSLQFQLTLIGQRDHSK